jgi:hypothetical protein
MVNRDVKFSSVLAAVTLMLILVLSVGSSAYAYSSIAGNTVKAPLAEHHKPGHDKGGGNGPFAIGDSEKENGNDKKDKGKRDIFGPTSMFQPVPSALDDFELSAEGSALTKRDGRDGPLTDAEINLRATVIREEGNHFRFYATGTVELDDGEEFDIVDAQGIIIFFKNLRGHSIAGLLHIVGKHAVDEAGNDLGKFRLRALVMGDPDDDTWRIVVFPSGKLGKQILLVNMVGTINGITDTEPPTPGSSSLSHFVISSVPSSVTAGSGINVTVTAHMSNGTLLKSYENKAKITDSTGTAKPVLTPKFQDGVFNGIINITKAASSVKLKFTDVGTGKSGESNSFTVLGGALTEVILTPSSVNLLPSSKAQFEAKGIDTFDNELSGLTFVWTLSSQDFGSISTAGSKANFTAASSISSNVKLNLTAAAGGKSDKSQIAISPSSSFVLDHFVIGNISSQIAGVPFQITITAVNSSGATLTGYAGPMRVTDSTGTLNMTVASGFVNGVWTGSANITKADDEVRITAADIASGNDGLSNEFVVAAGALHHFEFNQIDNQTAGAQFTVVVKARDAFSNLVTNFQGNVTLGTNDSSSPNGNVTLFAPASYNFTTSDEGQHAFAATMYNAKENVTVTASGSGKSGVSNEFDVTPAPVAKISVSPTSATVSLGGKATFSAQAFDSYGNSVPGANFQWSLDSDVLGEIDELTASTAEFTASSVLLATTSGTVSAKVGAVTGSASVTVQV